MRKVFNLLHFWLAGMGQSSQEEEEEHTSDVHGVTLALTNQFLHYLSATSNVQWDLASPTSPTLIPARQARSNSKQSLVTTRKESSTSSAYQELDSCALFSDTVSFLDIISPGAFPQDHCHAQWWKCSLQNSRLDVMPEPEPASADEKLGHSCRDCMLSILRPPSLELEPSVLKTSNSWSHYYQRKK